MLKTKRKTKPARSRPGKSIQEVLTLAETAAYLRVRNGSRASCSGAGPSRSSGR